MDILIFRKNAVVHLDNHVPVVLYLGLFPPLFLMLYNFIIIYDGVNTR